MNFFLRRRRSFREEEASPPRAKVPSMARCLLLFLLLVAIYLSNGDFFITSDAEPNMYLAVNLLQRGRWSFSPQEIPLMFNWTVSDAGLRKPANFRDWNQQLPVDGRMQSMQQLQLQGRLQMVAPYYYLVAGPDGRYVGQYGPGAGLCALPFFWMTGRLGYDLETDRRALWNTGKVAATFYVALSAVFLFLGMRRLYDDGGAMVLALLYGLATCAWSLSSQALWQHGPCDCFLALGTCLWLWLGQDWRPAALCGMAYGAAVVCRPTALLLAIAVAAYMDRRRLPAYLAGLALFILPLAAYNNWFLGAPWAFGQTEAASAIAMAKTGAKSVWSTPLWLGAAGALLSPSRGLFIFSPFLAFALWGVRQAFVEPRARALRPLAWAVLGMWVVQFKWFDWWAGWSYGYRQLLDSVILLVPFLTLVMPRITKSAGLRAVFALTVTWSVLMQILGAFYVDAAGWNFRAAYQLVNQPRAETRVALNDDELQSALADWPSATVRRVNMDIDEWDFKTGTAPWRGRLWSLHDSQLLYCLSDLPKRYRQRHRSAQAYLHP